MTLEEIHELWEKDAYIDESELNIESLKIPTLHSKYYKIYNTERLRKVKLETELKELKREKYEFYTQGPSEEHLRKGWRYPGGKILKNESEIYIESDQDYINLSLKIAVQNEKVDLLKSILTTLNNRSYHIMNSIEFLKFINGQN